jgi:hypothetical protein
MLTVIRITPWQLQRMILLVYENSTSTAPFRALLILCSQGLPLFLS